MPAASQQSANFGEVRRLWSVCPHFLSPRQAVNLHLTVKDMEIWQPLKHVYTHVVI